MLFNIPLLYMKSSTNVTYGSNAPYNLAYAESCTEVMCRTNIRHDNKGFSKMNVYSDKICTNIDLGQGQFFRQTDQ
jgi:hypothetical protein